MVDGGRSMAGQFGPLMKSKKRSAVLRGLWRSVGVKRNKSGCVCVVVVVAAAAASAAAAAVSSLSSSSFCYYWWWWW